MNSDLVSSSELFDCTMCGDCCRGYGGTFLTPEDVDAISDFLGIDPKRLLTEFCQLSGGKPVLAQGKEGYCVFWDRNCRIHPVKPRMCKAWPFIESILVDTRNWAAMAGGCPGMRTGFSEEQIRACVAEVIKKRTE